MKTHREREKQGGGETETEPASIQSTKMKSNFYYEVLYMKLDMGDQPDLKDFGCFLNMAKKNLLLGLHELLSYSKMLNRMVIASVLRYQSRSSVLMGQI